MKRNPTTKGTTKRNPTTKGTMKRKLTTKETTERKSTTKKTTKRKERQADVSVDQLSPETLSNRKRKNETNLTEPSTKRKKLSPIKSKKSSINANQLSQKNADKKINITKENKKNTSNATTKNKAPSMSISKKNKISSKKDKNNKIVAFPPEIEIIHTLKTTFCGFKNLVSHIISIDEKTLWIGRQAFSGFMKVHYNMHELELIKEFPESEHEFDDLCYDPFTNEMLYSDRKNSCVMSVMEDFGLRVFKCVKPMEPTCITVSHDNHIYIGLVDQYNYDETPNRAIVKLSRDGSECLRIMGKEKKKLRFCFPHRIVINPVNNHIIVSAGLNEESGYQGKVTNFNQEGKLTFDYRDPRPDIKFKVIGLTCSQKGNIVCANEFNGDIHILDKAGTLLNIVYHSSLHIQGIPWTVSFDKQGHLMIGAYLIPHGEIYIAKYTEH